MGIKDYLYTPEEAMALPPISLDGTVDKLGRGNLSFGSSAMIPGITVDGRSYELAMEQMSEGSLKGIPVHRDGKVIGYVDMDYSGAGTIHLNEGESLNLDQQAVVTYTVGKMPIFGTGLEAAMLDNVNDCFRKVLGWDDVTEPV